MKKKKIEDPGMMSADSLVKMARESHDKVMSEASKQEAVHKKKVDALTAEEKVLTAEIETGKEQLEKMIADFEALEKEKKSEILETVKSQSISEDDVKSGKVSMAEFVAAGESAEQIEREATQRTSEELEKGSEAIRSKATEITKLELSLYTAQSTIYNMLCNPVKLLLGNYKELVNILSFQLESMNKGGVSAHYSKQQKQHELFLCERGVSPSGGQVWRDITLEAAYRLRLDPTLPTEHIPALLEQLSHASEDDRFTVTFYPPGFPHPHGPLLVRREG